jgi:ferredoxin
MKVKLNASDQLLIERIEDLGHAVEYQCRKGYCGSCVADLLSGEVQYKTPPKAFHRTGEVILCCAVAVGEVEVAFNE